MKKHILYTAIVALCLNGLNGCELKEEPTAAIFTTNFYKTASDAEAAIIAVYDPMMTMYFGPSPLMVPDLSADQIFPRPVVGRNTLTLFNYDPNYTTQKSFNRVFESPLSIFQQSYLGIERANWVLQEVPAISMDDVRKKEILGEAYFLRAFFHWTLTRNFGEIPVKIRPSTSLEEATVGKSSKADIYKQIYSDLDKATENLLSYTPALVKGRPSKEVAQGLYAKVALYNEDWTTALQKAQAVINSGKYALMPDVLDVYNVAKEDVARQEVMWAIEAEGVPFPLGRSSYAMALYGPKNSESPEYGRETYGSLFAYPVFYNSFNSNDKRRLLLATSYTKADGSVVEQKNITPVTQQAVLVRKYRDPNSNGANQAINIPVLRLADVYLIAAEAEARLNGATLTAYNSINQVRRRAFGQPLNTVSIYDLTPGLSKEAFIDAVLQERSWELFAEGDRWYDLTRTGKFLTVIPQAVNDLYPVRTPQPRHKYFPIPQDEINANPKLEQNPDWQ